MKSIIDSRECFDVTEKAVVTKDVIYSVNSEMVHQYDLESSSKAEKKSLVHSSDVIIKEFYSFKKKRKKEISVLSFQRNPARNHFGVLSEKSQQMLRSVHQINHHLLLLHYRG